MTNINTDLGFIEEQFVKETSDITNELDSEIISKNNKFYNQINLIKTILNKVFWKFSKYIQLTNRFMIYIWSYLDAYHELSQFIWVKDSKQYKEIIKVAIIKWDMVKSFLIDNYPILFDKMEKEMDDKDIKKALDHFLKVLKDKI